MRSSSTTSRATSRSTTGSTTAPSSCATRTAASTRSTLGGRGLLGFAIDPPGGSAWESNPPRDAERRATGFEDQGSHRAPTAPSSMVAGRPCEAVRPDRPVEILFRRFRDDDGRHGRSELVERQEPTGARSGKSLLGSFQCARNGAEDLGDRARVRVRLIQRGRQQRSRDRPGLNVDTSGHRMKSCRVFVIELNVEAIRSLFGHRRHLDTLIYMKSVSMNLSDWSDRFQPSPSSVVAAYDPTA